MPSRSPTAVLLFAAVLPSLCSCGAERRPATEDLILGPETTVIVAPLRPDGTPDYVAALNQQLSAGLAPADNAFVDLARLLRDDAWPSEAHREAVFELLGVPLQSADQPAPFTPYQAFAPPAPPPPPAEDLPLIEGFDPGLMEESELGLFGDADRPVGLSDGLPDEVLEGPWTPEAYPAVAAWLEANDEALTRVERASRKPRFYAPLVLADDSDLLVAALRPHLGVLRQLSGMLVARANLRLGQGDPEAGWRDIMTIKRYSRHLAREPFVISRLVGVSIASRTDELIAGLAADRALTADRLRSMLEDLRTLPAMPGMAETLDRSERFSVLEPILEIYRAQQAEQQPGAGLVGPQAAALAQRGDVNGMLRQINHGFDQFVSFTRIEPSTAQLAAWQRYREHLDQRLQELAQQAEEDAASLPPMAANQAVTDLLLGVIAPAFGAAARTDAQLRAVEEIERAVLAVATYRAEHAAYPDQLAQLVPAYLPHVPADMLHGQPLLYRDRPAEGGLTVYSRGWDGDDDGGIPADWGEEDGDLVLRVGPR